MAVKWADGAVQYAACAGGTIAPYTYAGSFPGPYQDVSGGPVGAADPPADGDEVYYRVEEVGGTSRWEVGRGAYDAEDGVARDTVLSSSTGSAVDWAGTETLVLSLVPPARWFESVSSLHAAAAALAGGRLTLSSTESVPSSDQTGKTTLYYLPHTNGFLGLYDGADWQPTAFSSASAATSGLSSSTVYDVFGYLSSGALALELLAWTSDTTRATALVRQDGVWCKTGALTRRWLGTVRTDGSTQFNDSASQRDLSNADNRVPRPLLAQPTDTGHAYTSTTYREWGNGSTLGVSRFSFVVGLAGDLLSAKAAAYAYNGSSGDSGAYCAVGVGLDGTTNSAAAYGTWVDFNGVQMNAFAELLPAAGHHTCRLLQRSLVSGSRVTTWVGKDATNQVQAALAGSFLG